MEPLEQDFTEIPHEKISEFGPTLIVAPHADDESLGCGGIAALLRANNIDVHIVLLSDGTLSHPISKEYPAERLRILREEELISACEILNIPKENIHFFRLKDRSVPSKDSPEFSSSCSLLAKLLIDIKVQSVFVPWRRDPHPDHRAAYQLVNEAKSPNHTVLEYAIWLSELGNPEDFPLEDEVEKLGINIQDVIKIKQDAIMAHRSQTTHLIQDDPDGFCLSKEMLEKFNVPFEYFYRDIR